MGQANQKSQIRVENPNDYFLSLTANPQKDQMLAEIYVANQSTYTEWNKMIQRVKESGPTNMLVARSSKIIEKPLCGENFKVQIDYPCYHILLSKEIDKRYGVDKYLQEAQMWYLVYCLTQTAHSCHQLGRKIGDVRPQNLLLNKDGNLKILSSLSVPSIRDTYDPMSSKNKNLHSPEHLQEIKKGYKESQLKYITSESFSIGMTILSAGILQDVSKCYNYNISELNMLEFNKKCNFWYQNQFYSENQKKKIEYSKQLKNIVMNLIEISPERRITSLQVYELLKNHKEKIMKLEPFEIEVERWKPRKLKSSSPSKKQVSQNVSTNLENIHILRSKKQSQKSSPKKVEKIEISYFNSNREEPSFNTPSVISSHQKELSPTRRKKINTSLTLSNNKVTEHK